MTLTSSFTLAQPYPTIGMSRFMVFGLMAEVKPVLIKALELNRFPAMVISTKEADYSESYIKWGGHLPRVVLGKNPDSLIEAACGSRTIAVVGDIRRSQDLMTYSTNPGEFARRMVEFITTTRDAIERHAGFFDKFTGDGFVAYFNEAICRVAGFDYIDCFLNFLRKELELAGSQFGDWVRQVRKLPEKPIGLAIGADLGVISFQNLKYHLVAVGEPIVWASRMAACASASEVVVNNLLFEALNGREGLVFDRREASTKSGEGFLGRVLRWTAGG